jgi:LemA protein
MSTGWIVIGVLVILVLFALGAYNRLVALSQRVGQAFADIDVQLKQRHDLIPNLLETVKGYAAHERQTLEAVTAARTNAVQAQQAGPAQQAQAENVLSGALRQLFALSESYPDLKANQNFLSLQEELTSTEDRIAYARQFYNDSVQKYNTKIQTFPTVIVAGMFNFSKREFFEAEQGSTEVPKVQF